MDIIRVSGELGYPTVCHFREALFIVPAIFQKAVTRYRAMGPFHGAVISVRTKSRGTFLSNPA
jgi:hypothetical protein